MSESSSEAFSRDPEAIFFDLDGTAVPNGYKKAPDDLVEAISGVSTPLIPVTGRTWVDAQELIVSIASGYAIIGGGSMILKKGKDDDYFHMPVHTREYKRHIDINTLGNIYSRLALEIGQEYYDDPKLISGEVKFVNEQWESEAKNGILGELNEPERSLAIYAMRIGHDLTRAEIGKWYFELSEASSYEIRKQGSRRLPTSMFIRGISDLSEAQKLQSLIMADPKPEVESHIVTAQDPALLDIHITSERATKAHAVREVAGLLAVDLSQCVAVGDGLNDVPMFGVVGASLAMGDAPKEVQAAANAILPPQDQGGFLALLSCLK